MKLRAWLGLAAIGLGWLGACGKASSGEQLGGETHWLKQCSASAECGSLECVCGVCTTRCDEDSACSMHAGNARCTPQVQTEYADACAETTARICVRPQNLEPGGSVETPVQGWRYDAARDCLEPLSFAGNLTREGVPTCDDALSFAFRGEECWRFPSSCIPDDFEQRGPVYIEDPCYEAPECGAAASCGAGDVTTAEGCLTCGEARNRLGTAITEFISDMGWNFCSSDGDCDAVAWESACDTLQCPAPMNKDFVDMFSADAPEINAAYCRDPGQWLAQCIPPSIPPCPGESICRAGRCVLTTFDCYERPLETCESDGDCALARAFPFDAERQCFDGASVAVGCVDPDLSCPPVTTAALDGEGDCFMFGDCLAAGFQRAPDEHACAAAPVCSP